MHELCSVYRQLHLVLLTVISGKTSDTSQFKLRAVKAAEKKSKEAGNKIRDIG